MCLQYAINFHGAFSPCWAQYRPTPLIHFIRTATHFKCHSLRLGFLKRWVFKAFDKLFERKKRRELKSWHQNLSVLDSISGSYSVIRFSRFCYQYATWLPSGNYRYDTFLWMGQDNIFVWFAWWWVNLRHNSVHISFVLAFFFGSFVA